MSSIPLLDSLGSSAILLTAIGLGGWWLLERRSSRGGMSARQSGFFWALLLVSLLSLLAVRALTRPSAFDESWIELAMARYEAMWSELDAASLVAAEALEELDLGSADRLEPFRVLTGLIQPAGPTFLLLDPEGRAAAWAGEGLLHDLERGPVPSTGNAFRTGFSAVTLASVRRVGGQTTAWRLIAGRSYSSQRLPFPSPSGSRRSDYLWAVDAAGSGTHPGATAVAIDGRPTLSVLMAPDAPHGGVSRRSFLLQLGWVVLALASFSAARYRRRFRDRLDLFGMLEPGTILGLAALGIAFRLAPLAAAVLVGGAVAAALAAWIARGRVFRTWAWMSAPAAVGLVVLLGYRLEKFVGPIDLAAALLPSAEAAAIRLGILFLIVAGLLPALAVGSSTGPPHRRRLWIAALALLVLGTALADRPLAAILCVGSAAGFGALWLGARSRLSRPSLALALIALAALTAAATWELTYRSVTGRYLDHDVAPLLGPPSAQETAALRSEVNLFLQGFDLARISAIDPARQDLLDLAYALWTQSPLATGGRLSSLAVILDGSAVSRFQFGIPLTADGDVDHAPELWQELDVPGWEDALIVDRSRLRSEGRVVGTVLWALLPRPGFRLVSDPPEQLAATLVRGTLTSRLPIEDVVEPATFAVYSERLRPVVGPPDSPPLPLSARASEFTMVDGTSRIRGWSHGPPNATEVILLRAARPLEALERVGVQSLGTLSVVAAIVLLFSLAGGVRLGAVKGAWSRIYRSYSRKLLLAYGTILLVPLLAVTLALLGVLGQRLQNTREVAGLEAMEAAQHVLGEYILSLEPGFGVDTALDNSLLAWISRVVNHEVNLYWGSRLYASSNPELFTAGLLPTRIPGEVFARLWLESATTASRVNRASGERYLEIYAPLRIPGVENQELLFLSIPLLAQQEEVQEEIAALRTRAVLAAVLLLVGMIATARRLSRGFTKPLTDLIAGTESIAAGASSLDLQPTELELAALVAAVNSMAARIAEARERLLVEKQVVEKVVQNITAGVVSLDQERRVLLCNAAATELIGVQVGMQLEEAVGAEDYRGALGKFLAESSALPRQATLRLRRPPAEESEWTVVWVPVPGEGEPTSLLVLEDVTEVLRGQRLEAWAEMARMIAHEIKNPLTPIRLSTEHMIEVHAKEPEQFESVFERCSTNILRQVDELQHIASEFSSYSSIPKIRSVPDDLVSAATEVIDSYRAAPPPGIAVQIEHEAATLPLAFDRRLLGRALRNLIENALNATVEGGEVLVRTRPTDNGAEITVADRGSGASAETLRRMFDPYFSTDSTGTGLGLPISRRIVEEHGGSMSAANRRGGGLRVTIRLPAA